MNMNQQHIQHLKQLQELKHENEQLKIELEFMNKLFDHGEAMVFQMKRFTKNGQPVWINTQKTTTKELLELDHNNEVQQLLIEQQNTRYKDR